jgi:hypothetical protein
MNALYQAAGEVQDSCRSQPWHFFVSSAATAGYNRRMRCSNCGNEIPPFDSICDSRDVLKGNRSRPGMGHEFVFISLCRECAKSRAAVRRTMLWTFSVFLVGLLVLAIIGLSVK